MGHNAAYGGLRATVAPTWPSRRLAGKPRRWTLQLRCAAIGGGLAAIGVRSGNCVPLSFAGAAATGGAALPDQRGRQRRGLALRGAAPGPLDEALSAVNRQVADVIDAPNRLAKETQQAVDKTLESLSKDDGRVLDEASPSGAVGAVAVSSAVLPYIPLSLYSSFLVLTTGKGVEPGPYGIFGIAEGLGTLVIFAMVAWSVTSLVTRARGLPEGPFGVLGAAQLLSYVAVAAFGLSQAFSGSVTVEAPNIAVPNIQAPPVLTEATSKLSQQVGQQVGELTKGPASFLGGLQSEVTSKLDGVKKQVGEEASRVAAEASSKVSQATSKVTDQASKVVTEAASKASQLTSSVKGAAQEAAQKFEDDVGGKKPEASGAARGPAVAAPKGPAGKASTGLEGLLD